MSNTTQNGHYYNGSAWVPCPGVPDGSTVQNGHYYNGSAWVPLPTAAPAAPPAPPAAPTPPAGMPAPGGPPAGYPGAGAPPVAMDPRAAGALGGLDDAETTNRSANFRAGMHEIEIRGIYLRPSQENARIWNWIVEGMIVRSQGGKPSSAQPHPTGGTHPLTSPHYAGEIVSWVCNNKNGDSLFKGNVRGFVGALVAPGQPLPHGARNLEELGYIAAGSSQPYAGSRVWCDATVILTKRERKDFTALQWGHTSTMPPIAEAPGVGATPPPAAAPVGTPPAPPAYYPPAAAPTAMPGVGTPPPAPAAAPPAPAPSVAPPGLPGFVPPPPPAPVG